MKDYAIKVIKEEAQAIMNLINFLDDDFSNCTKIILESNARVILTGVGKSGLIGKKISTTLASTGTPSFFLHPTEAFHGDLGMIKSEDIIIAITNSGETDEVLKLIPFLKSNGNILIALTGDRNSTLARNSDYVLNSHVEKEVCPLNLAPTTSATAALVLGDALVVALMKERNFQPSDYARFHPGGNLGRRLLIKAKDIMQTNNLPVVKKDCKISDAMLEISKARLGLVVIEENKNTWNRYRW